MKETTGQAVLDWLSRLEVGESLTFTQMAAFPLFGGAKNGEQTLDYCTLGRGDRCRLGGGD